MATQKVEEPLVRFDLRPFDLRPFDPVPAPAGGGAREEGLLRGAPAPPPGGAAGLSARSRQGRLWCGARGRLRLRGGEDDQRGRGLLQVGSGDPWTGAGPV